MIRRIVAWSLAHRIAVLVVAAAVLSACAVVLAAIKIDVLPDVTRPSLVIMTEAPGFSAEDVETRVTLAVEAAGAGLPRAQRIRSSSVVGLSVVTIELDWAADAALARQIAIERLNVVRDQLPAGVVPQIQPISSIMGEIMLIALTSTDSGTQAAFRLRGLADWTVRPRLLAVPGVSQVSVIGGAVAEIDVSPDPLAMAGLNVTIADLERALSGVGVNSGGGIVAHQGSEQVVRVIAAMPSPEALAQITVAMRDGVPVTLGQVARVAQVARPSRGAGGADGAEAVILSVQKQPGADTRAITARVGEVMAQLRGALPADVRADKVLFRQADFIDRALGNVSGLLVEASVVVGLVIVALLGGWRPSVISLIALPSSLLIAVATLHVFGFSLNVMTLGGFAIAIGELVDDAVVDVENVTRRLRQNAAAAMPRPAALVVLDAAQEVRTGIVQATAIIALVMLPLFVLPGIEGQLLRPLALAYVAAMAASLLTALTLTPVLCAVLLRSGASAGIEPPLAITAKRLVADGLTFALARKPLVYGAAVAFVVIGAVVALLRPSSLMPLFNEGSLTVEIASRPGIALGQSSGIGAAAERVILGVPGVATTGRRTGRAELDEHTQGVEISEIDVLLSGKRSRTAVADDIRAKLGGWPVAVNVGQPISHRIEHMTSGVRAQLAAKLYGDDAMALARAAQTVRDALAGVGGLQDLQIERQVLIPTVDVRPDAGRAGLYGLSPAAVGQVAGALLGGKVLSQMIDGPRRVDLVLRLAEAERQPGVLANALVETPGGAVPLGWLADVTERFAMSRIEREDGQRRTSVYANFGPGASGGIADQVTAALARVELPAGIRMALEGTFQQQGQATRLFTGLAVGIVGLVVVGLAMGLRSLRLALIVLASIPLALAGGMLTLGLSGLPHSLASMVGLVTLTGIAARNGILKVNYLANQVREGGRSFGPDLVIEACQRRIVPVLMTALAAALGLLPILITGSDVAGSELLHPVATVVFGGLVAATVLDTFLTPLLLLAFAGVAFECG